MNELFDLYQEIILDHNRRPRNFRAIAEPTCSADGYNPICGDEIRIFLKLDGEKIEDVSFQGQGCAISKASASLMTVKLKGKTLIEAEKELKRFQGMLAEGEDKEVDILDFGDLASLSGVRRFPARIKCATLAWHAVEAALQGKGQASTE